MGGERVPEDEPPRKGPAGAEGGPGPPESAGGLSGGEKPDPEGGGLFRAIVDRARDAVIVVDDGGAVVYMNRAGEELFGYEPGEVVGRPLHASLIPEKYRDYAAQAFAALAEGSRDGIVGSVREFTALRKNGAEFPLEVSVSSCTLEGRTFYFTICRDLSDSKRMEQELHRHRAHLEGLIKTRTQRLREMAGHYRSLVDTSPDCIALTDLDGNILMINRSGLRLFGIAEAKEMLGRNVLEFFAPEEKAQAMASMRTRVEGESARNEEYELLRRDGTRFHAEVSASLMRDAEGRPLGFVSVTRDISNRKRAEEKLQKINRCFLELGPDPTENMQRLTLTAREVLEADMARYDRILKGSVLSFSSSLPDAGFVPLRDPEKSLCAKLISAGMVGTATAADLEEGALAGDPEARGLGMRSFLIHPVRMRETAVGCLAVMFARERGFSPLEKDTIATLARALGIEEERFAYEESLRDLVDIASHELRHPVALLAGFAETLAESADEMDPETRDEVVGAIRQASQRLTALTRDLLDVSLAERDRFFLHKAKGDLSSLITRSAEEMGLRAPDVAFRVSIDPGLEHLSFDEDRIRNLMVILLENAWKYSPPGSEIEVRAEGTDGGALVSVMDRGTGIEEEHRERVFERFYQVEEAQHHSKPGLGLGLYLGKRIVEDHGGRIWYEPREGGGSIFRFTLPR